MSHTRATKGIFFYLAIALATLTMLSSCNRGREEVVLTYPNGKPQIIQYVKGKGDNKKVVGDKYFYESGILRCERHYKNGNPDGKWTFNYVNGKLFAQGTFDDKHPSGTNWTFKDLEGKDIYQHTCDSIVMLGLSPNKFPAGAAFHHDGVSTIYQFYEDCSKQSEGTIVEHQRHGKWTFFYPTGAVQTEAIFEHGSLEGPYKVFRENGIPYYIGTYTNNQRSGIWEFYDELGNLSTTKNFSEE